MKSFMFLCEDWGDQMRSTGDESAVSERVALEDCVFGADLQGTWWTGRDGLCYNQQFLQDMWVRTLVVRLNLILV